MHRFLQLSVPGMIVLMLTALPGRGQMISGLPKLLPQYSENFSAKRELPQTCVSDVVMDRRGRLWVATCPVMAGVNSMRLFQFDGYEFNPVNLANDSLPDRTLAILKTITPEGELLGWFESEYVNSVFFFDPERRTTSMVAFNRKQEGIIRDILLQPDGKVLAVLTKTDSLSLYRMDKNCNKEFLATWDASGEARGAGLTRKVSLYASGDEAFVACTYPFRLFQIQLREHLCRNYPVTDFVPNPVVSTYQDVSSDDFSSRFISTPQGDLICFVPDAAHQVFIRHGSKTSFEPMSGLPDGYLVSRVEQDASGNILFLMRDRQEQHAALLYDRLGRRYDYSAFVADHLSIYNIRSTNFLQDVFVCADDGLSYKSVQKENTVQCLLADHSIRGMVEAADGQFMITSQNRPTVRYQAASGAVEIPAQTDPFIRAFGNSTARNFSRAKDGSLWSNRGDTLVQYFPASGAHRDYAVFPGLFYQTLIADERMAIFTQQQGLFFFDPKTGKSSPLKNGDYLYNFKGLVHSIKQTRDGRLWLLTTNGLLQIDLGSGVAKRLGFELPFRDFRFFCMEEAPDGKLWLGTFLGGIHIYDPQTGAVRIVDKSKGLPSNTIASITCDAAGDFWAATYRGLSHLSPDGIIIANVLREEGLCELEFNRYASLRAKDDALLLGTIHGLQIIRPRLLEAQRKASNSPQIYLTSLTAADAETGVDRTIQSSFDHLPLLVLPPDRRHLRVSFALSNYVQPDRNQFAYLLEGVDNTWNSIGPQHELSFNDLPPGTYNLLIKGCDFQGNWTLEPVRIPIHARDFFYKQPWFYALCLLPFLAFGWVWLQRLRSEKKRLEKEVQRRTQQIRQDKALIEQQAHELLQLDGVKSRFFTNISHELRTPITLITAPVERLLQKYNGQVQEEQRQSLQSVLYNGRKLAELVEELLELSRLEADKAELLETPTEFYPYCRQIFSAFESQAQMKHIRYTFHYEAERNWYVNIDRRRLEKIINNLISNALKFTQSEGKVQFTVHAESSPVSSRATIRVEDNGRGIPPEDMPHLFERYFQTKRTDMAREGGTGIGLALAKELAQLMKGDLRVESEWGKGSTFTLLLPLKTAPAPVSANSGVEQVMDPVTDLTYDPVDPAPVSNHGASDRNRLLVAEDNPDMRALLRSLLSDEYTLTVAHDGQEAWDLLNAEDERTQHLSLILSDVMMPRMDGYELLEKIKSHPRWQRVPAILLTARAEQEDKIQALRLGVDDYLVKPFSPAELSARVANLIVNYRRRQIFSEQGKGVPAIEFEKVEAQSNVWLKTIETAAKHALDKGLPLQVSLLAEAGAMSERQLYREIKRCTGLTPHQYILEVRLQKARHLLQHRAYGTLAEVAYAVGFDTPGYFTKVFEQHFGKHPSAYLILPLETT